MTEPSPQKPHFVGHLALGAGLLAVAAVAIAPFRPGEATETAPSNQAAAAAGAEAG